MSSVDKVDEIHITVKFIQDAIRNMSKHFSELMENKEESYEKYIKPIGMKLIKICEEQLNQLDEKDRYFPNLISNEEDLKHLVELIQGSF